MREEATRVCYRLRCPARILLLAYFFLGFFHSGAGVLPVPM